MGSSVSGSSYCDRHLADYLCSAHSLLDPVVHFRNVEVFITLCNFECIYYSIAFVCSVGQYCHYTQCISSSSSLGGRCVPWLGEGLSMSSPNYPVLCCPLPYRVAPVFVQVVSPSLGWSPLSYFLVIWSPCGDARGPSVVFEAVNMPCPGHYHQFAIELNHCLH